MEKRKSGSSALGKVVERKRKRISKKKINYSDIPELDDSQLASMKRVGRPPFGNVRRRLIAIRIDPIVLDKIRRIAEDAGKGYQTLINEILAKYIEKKPA